ncbi:MAG: ribosome silencing factor [Lachnospiraceae bacterium]|nr:ribosome silencing factor [Lachnospiraceae bacterium]
MKATAKEQVKALYKALNEKQAQEIRVIDISKVSTLADYFVITNGRNTPHVDSLVQVTEETMQKMGVPCRNEEGLRGGRWVLLDYADVVVHIFSREDRLWYDLEKIWRDGEAVPVSELEDAPAAAPEE